jgi:hypothetical protein
MPDPAQISVMSLDRTMYQAADTATAIRAPSAPGFANGKNGLFLLLSVILCKTLIHHILGTSSELERRIKWNVNRNLLLNLTGVFAKFKTKEGEKMFDASVDEDRLDGLTPSDRSIFLKIGYAWNL